jgi:hypothetical protein
VSYGRCQRPEPIFAPDHLLEQILIRPAHIGARSFLMIGQDVRRPVDPLVGLADHRP